MLELGHGFLKKLSQKQFQKRASFYKKGWLRFKKIKKNLLSVNPRGGIKGNPLLIFIQARNLILY